MSIKVENTLLCRKDKTYIFVRDYSVDTFKACSLFARKYDCYCHKGCSISSDKMLL